MPETTENYHRIPNPNYSGSAFDDEKTRTATISEPKGIKALYAPLKRNGAWKVRTFLFARDKWPNMEACQTWVREHKESFKGIGGFETVWTGEAQFVQRASDSAPTADELEIINGYALKPLEAEEIYVREMRLTNDRWGRNHVVRLSRGFQGSILNDLPGKSLLLGHPEVKANVAAVPEGVFFEAWEDFEKDTETAWGVAKFYMVKTAGNEHMRKQIDGGVYKHTSVGMRLDEQKCSICGEDIFSQACSHIPGETYPLSEVASANLNPERCETDPERVYCGVIFRGQGSALEGSIVYWPELHGTQVVAEAQLAARQGDFAGAKQALFKTAADAADTIDETGQGAADATPGKDGGSANTSEGESDMTPEEQKALEEAKAEAEGKVATLDAEKTELTTKVDGLEKQVGTLEAVTAQAKAFREAIIEDVKRLAGLLKREAELETFGAALEDMEPEKLLALQADWTKKVDEALPGGRQSTPTDRDNATGEPTGPDGAEGQTLSINPAFVG